MLTATNYFRSAALLISLFIALLSSHALQAQLPQAEQYKTWKQVGSAKLEVLWFDIYYATLSTPSGTFNGKSPFRLEINYLRAFSAEELIEETLNQWQNKVPVDQQTGWANQLKQLWPNIEEGDRLSFVVDTNQLGHFYFNNKYLGRIDDADFSKPFSDIWLGTNSQFPKLAKQLRGEE